MDSVFLIFTMLGGLAVFMFGMNTMSDNLETMAGSRVKSLFNKISDNPIKGVGIGLGVTAIIQSSAATTVMCVGFVNVGVMSLYQATAIIMGSNIGTTVTAQLSSLSALNITAIMSLVAAVGFFMSMFSKNDSVKRVGTILVGLGMIFIGLNLMSGSLKKFAMDDSGNPTEFAMLMLNTFKSPLLSVIGGLVFTALIQSSSASTGVLLAFGAAGVVTLQTSMFMILGMNIGTCVTALLASMGTSANARRTAVIHLLFNVIGCLLWFIALSLFGGAIEKFIEAFSGSLMERQIANFHTLFNVVVTLVLLPFSKQLVKLSTLIVRDKKPADLKPKRLYYLDERLLQTPSIAMSQVFNEIRNMADMAMRNATNAIDMLTTGNVDGVDEVKKNEEIINFLNKEIANYLVKLSNLEISAHDEDEIATFYHVISDIERIGDYAENIMEFAVNAHNNEVVFSDEAKNEIVSVKEKLVRLYKECIYAFMKRNEALLPEIDKIEDEIDAAKLYMQEKHIERLNKGACSVESGAIYLSLSTQMERMADHMTNIAYSIRPYKRVVEKNRATEAEKEREEEHAE